VPGILYHPYQAVSTLLSPEGQYRLGGSDYDRAARLGLEAAGLSAAGVLANRPANAIAAGLARRQALPMDAASRAQRAAEMGFDTSERLFHGTNREFSKFDLGRAPPAEQALWLSPDPEAAGYFAQFRAGGWDKTRTLPLHVRGRHKIVDREYLQREYGEQFASRTAQDPEWVSPLETQGGAIHWDPQLFQKELQRARREGYDGVRFVKVDEGMGQPADQIAIFDPANIRSVNARFNPRNSNSPNLLSTDPRAGALPAVGERDEW
jgi:hypothetical protein